MFLNLDEGEPPHVSVLIDRYKSIIGDSLKARDEDAQVTEVAIGIKLPNQMIKVAKPISVRI